MAFRMSTSTTILVPTTRTLTPFMTRRGANRRAGCWPQSNLTI
jgi:hypothetical protein